jgi:hypothetical protein
MRVQTNNTTLAYAEEAEVGVLPGNNKFTLLEPNTVSSYGATITTVARNPISQNRQRRKGTVTDLDSAVDWDGDFTVDNFVNFAEGFVFALATFDNVTFQGEPANPNGYGVPALESDQVAILHSAPGGGATLFLATGYSKPENNGLKYIISQPFIDDETIPFNGCSAEVPPSNATLDIAGYRGGEGDFSGALSGTEYTLTNTSFDLTTLGLTAGQFVHIGGPETANQFPEGYGYGRIISISSDDIVLDKLDATLATSTGSGVSLDLLFGRFIRNVPTSHPDFLERSYTFELTYPNLNEDGADRYEYASGNISNTLGINLPLSDKAGLTYGFIGTDAQPPTDVRVAGADTPVLPLDTGAFNTTIDCTRLRIAETDDSGTYTDFKNLTVTLNNNVSPEKVLANLGARYMNFGNYEIDIEAQLIFSDYRVASAVRENRTMTMDFGVKNDNGAIVFDIPSMTLGGGDKEFPVNESVLINTTAQAFQDPTLDTSIGISIFPVVP